MIGDIILFLKIWWKQNITCHHELVITRELFTSRTKKMHKPLLIIRISEAFLMQFIRTKAYEGNVL